MSLDTLRVPLCADHRSPGCSLALRCWPTIAGGSLALGSIRRSIQLISSHSQVLSSTRDHMHQLLHHHILAAPVQPINDLRRRYRKERRAPLEASRHSRSPSHGGHSNLLHPVSHSGTHRWVELCKLHRAVHPHVPPRASLLSLGSVLRSPDHHHTLK